MNDDKGMSGNTIQGGTMTLYAVCDNCAHIESYPARDVNDEESAPYSCEKCGHGPSDIGYGHDEAVARSDEILNERGQ